MTKKKNYINLSIRVSVQEMSVIQDHFKKSGCKSKNQYIKKFLIEPTLVFEDFITRITCMQAEVKKFEVFLDASPGNNILNDPINAKSYTRQYAEKWTK